MTNEHDGVSRRDFFKLAGLTAAGSGSSSSPFGHPWWVREVDKPTLMETNDQYQRFAGTNIQRIYNKLKDEKDGQGAAAAEAQAKTARVA